MEKLRQINRRDFLKWGAKAAAGLGLTLAAGGCGKEKETPTPDLWKEAVQEFVATKIPKAPATPRTPEATPSPTATSGSETAEIINTVETTKIPVPTANPETLAVPEVLPEWPKTPEKAAALFGGKPQRWEKNPDGGWHLKEEGSRIKIDPRGYLAEGYYDTKPGKNPLCIASAGVEVEIQGGTIWSERGTEEATKKLQQKMAIPIWDDGQQHPCKLLLPEKN